MSSCFPMIDCSVEFFDSCRNKMRVVRALVVSRPTVRGSVVRRPVDGGPLAMGPLVKVPVTRAPVVRELVVKVPGVG